MTKNPVVAIIAAINEEEGIGRTIKEIKNTLDDPYIIVVDGKSKDRTCEIAQKLGAKVLIQRGRGKGNAISQGLNHVSEEKIYVVFIDADYSYPAKYIPEMIQVLQKNPKIGMILGNRFSSQYQTISDVNKFYVGNIILAFIQNIFYQNKLNDPLTGLRVIRYNILRNWKPKSKGFGIEAEINFLVERKGFEIVEIPVIYRKRLGKKKLGFRHGFEIVKRIIIESLRN